MHERERWRLILESLSNKGVVTVRQLEKLLKTSSATVRRDLRRLEARGTLRRVHGGAEINQDSETKSLIGQESFAFARSKHAQEKKAIAKRAASLCEDDSSIIIDGGSTTFMMVSFIKERPLQILTSSFPIADALNKGGKARVIVPGGEIYREQQLILSPFHDGVISSFSAAKMFMGAQAITPAGLMQTDPILIQSEQRLLGRAEELIVLADSSKFAQTGGLILCPLSEIDVVITDSNISKEASQMLSNAGIKVITVPVQHSDMHAA